MGAPGRPVTARPLTVGVGARAARGTVGATPPAPRVGAPPESPGAAARTATAGAVEAVAAASEMVVTAAIGRARGRLRVTGEGGRAIATAPLLLATAPEPVIARGVVQGQAPAVAAAPAVLGRARPGVVAPAPRTADMEAGRARTTPWPTVAGRGGAPPGAPHAPSSGRRFRGPRSPVRRTATGSAGVRAAAV